MKSCKPVLGLLLLAAVAYGGYQYFNPPAAEAPTTPVVSNEATTPVETVTEAEISAAELTVQNILGQSLADHAAESGKFVAYSEAEAAANQDAAHVVFFHANWCSWCRKREQEILENIDALPANTKILKADFDKEIDLRQKYGVTNKDTFIFVAPGGEFTLKNGASLETIEKFFIESIVTPGEERPDGLGGYFEYDADVVETFKGNKPFALFFHATWCPPCRALDAEIKETLTTLPANPNIFKVDYDTSDELKKLYGVTQQHTFVYFKKNGEVDKVETGTDLADVIAYFQ